MTKKQEVKSPDEKVVVTDKALTPATLKKPVPMKGVTRMLFAIDSKKMLLQIKNAAKNKNNAVTVCIRQHCPKVDPEIFIGKEGIRLIDSFYLKFEEGFDKIITEESMKDLLPKEFTKGKHKEIVGRRE